MQVLYFVFYFVAVLGIRLDDFYPYGRQNGDTVMSKSDEGSSPDIPIPSLFPFYNHQHSKLKVRPLRLHIFLLMMHSLGKVDLNDNYANITL